MSDQVKNIMLNMYPKKRIPVTDDPEPEVYPESLSDQLPEQYNLKGNKTLDKWLFSASIAGICVFLFSSFFLDFVDEICMKRDTSAFNSKGEPTLYLVSVIFIIILLISRTFFSLI
jgi:hypothetical protein